MADGTQGRHRNLSTTQKVTLSMLPTEIFFTLFKFLPPKDMIRSREVCSKWRDIIDAMLKDDGLWEEFCKRDYNSIYKKAMWKSPNIKKWSEMYFSLSLWAHLEYVDENIDEFCYSDTIDEEIRGAVVQENGVVMVHKRTRVVFHDVLSLDVVRRRGFSGQYISMIELLDVVVMLEWNGQLHVVNKPNKNWHSDLLINTNNDDEIWFNDVKSFIVGDRTVFFLTYHQEFFSFQINEDKAAKKINIPENFTDLINDGFITLAYSAGCLHILTTMRNMYIYENKQIALKFSLDNVSNLMNCFYVHNMLEIIDWRQYYIIQAQLGHEPHIGEAQYIRKMSVYGDDLFYACSLSGKVLVYYKPFVNGQLCFNEFEPIKVYDFSMRIEYSILSVIPIVNIEFIETTEGHIVLVCLPRKILKLTYKHDFLRPLSRAILG